MKLIAIPTRDGMVDDHFDDCDHHQEKPVYFVPSFGK